MRAHASGRVICLALAMASCSNGSFCPDGDPPRTFEVLKCDDACTVCQVRTVTACQDIESDCPGWYGGGSCSGNDGIAGWVSRPRDLSVVHVVDGEFTGEEWADATMLTGQFTDVYMDYQDGMLFLLNDWRLNDQGIRPECFNFFRLGVAGETIELRVFGDGRVEVTRHGVPDDVSARGAYGFSPSPSWSKPHTIFEFSLKVDATQIDVCCFDPSSYSNCEELVHEPVVFSIRPSAGSIQVSKAVPDEVVRLPMGSACGREQGVCADGLSCGLVDGFPQCVGLIGFGPRPLPAHDDGPLM